MITKKELAILPKKAFPEKVKPMLATLVDEPFNKKDWIFEIKWDGYRAIASHNGRLELYSRNGNSLKEKFPNAAEAVQKIKHQLVLDGEIVALDKDGKPNFQYLQNKNNRALLINYMCFDLLYLDGKDLTHLPLIKRKEVLHSILPKSSILKFSRHIPERGKDLFDQARKMSLEGIIAKDANSIYQTGIRSRDWLKIKITHEQEAVIVGFTKPKGSRKYIGALVLALYDGKDLVYIGHSGSGFNSDNLSIVYKELLPLVTKKSALTNPDIPIHSPITWVLPRLLAQIKFSEWTSDGIMRHPIFLGLRMDKSPKDVIFETPKQSKLIIKNDSLNADDKDSPNFTNLQKIYWPKEKYTKGDVIEYYREIASIILPYLKDRPQSLNRHPNGIKGTSFYQKNIQDDNLPKFIKTIRIKSGSSGSINYMLCQNEMTLLYMANLGCIEINPWNSRYQFPDNPDYIVMDIDPDNGSFSDLIKVVQTVHDVMEILCLPHYCKTSGKTGFHIYVPLDAQYTYGEMKTFARVIASIVHKKLPGITSIERRVQKRNRKIYIDFLQNRRGQTLAAPYSLRPWPNATVSTPLKWEEVTNKLDITKFTIQTIGKRIDKIGDIWKPVLKEKLDMKRAIDCMQDYLNKL